MDAAAIASLLETTMLVCFGFSWPINLIKNYRARSAKAMSLGFILLIIAGYVAGLAAKFIAIANADMPWYQTVPWYVMLVYILNLVIVSLNLLVYFRNRELDRRAEGR